VFVNPVAYVLESMTPVTKHDSFLTDLKIKNHMAMTNLTQGKATRDDMDSLIAMGNAVEALYRLGFGRDYDQVVTDGIHAILTVSQRGVANGHRFILNAKEMNALNSMMELHDAQMEVITVRDMENAMNLMRKEYEMGKMTPIVRTKP
jgi:hypothetical protein